MKISRLPKDTGPAAWNSLLPQAPAAAPLIGDIQADWLIIGAGFAGLAAAQRLSQLDPSGNIALVDACRVAEGPAGRNSGFMIDLPHDLASSDYGGALDADRAQTRDNRRAIEFAADMAEEFNLPKEAFARSGKINAAASDKGHRHNLDYAEHLNALGEEHQLYDAAKMQAITGTNYYQSGLFTPKAVILQPAMFVRGVAEGLVAKGISLYENSPVVQLERGRSWEARTPQGRIRAPKVILAVNGHLNSFGFFKSRLMHVFTYASMTRELTPHEVAQLGGEANWGVTPADPLGTTVRRISGTGGDRIIIRNRFTFEASMTVNQQRIAATGRTHDKSFTARFPMLKNVTMEHRWGGRLCLSLNNVQVVRELEQGLYAACVQNGLGTAKGTLAGLLAAELATGTPSEQLNRALAAPAPKRLPPEPLASLGANARLRWSEWCAGRDL